MSKLVTDARLGKEIAWAKKFSGKVSRTKDQYALTKLARALHESELGSYTLSMRLADEVVDRAVLLKHDALRDGLGVIRVPERRTAKQNMGYLERIAAHGGRQLKLGQRVSHVERSWRGAQRNPSGKGGRSSSPKRVKLRAPKRTPDFEHVSWMGSDCRSGRIVEWKMADGEVIDLDDQKKWVCLWSPKYHAIVSVPCPRRLTKMMKVDRSLGAAKAFERFMARDSKSTWESTIPDVPVVKLGKVAQFTYRSDKWKTPGDTQDFYHDLGNATLYCGPSKSSPQIFFAYGGKLTVTERGFVF